MHWTRSKVAVQSQPSANNFLKNPLGNLGHMLPKEACMKSVARPNKNSLRSGR